MAAPPSPSMTEETRQGFKYFRVLAPLLAPLRPIGTERERAGNRQVFYNPYASWLLLDFFHPVVTSLRGLQRTTTLAKVQERRGGHQTSLRTLSEAAYVFDATLWHEVLTTLGAQLRPPLPLAEQAALAQLPAVDGSLLPALPRMAWALWQDDQHRAAKLHGACAVLCQGPVDVTVTAGNGSERAAWRRLVPPGGFDVVDRGSVDSRLFQALHDVPCSFLGRVKDNAAYEVQEARALSPAAVQAGGGRRCGPPSLGHGAPYARAATAVPCGAGRDRQDAAGWHARRGGPGHQSAGPGRGVDCRGVSVSVGGRTVFPLGQRCLGLPACAEPGDQRGAHPGVGGLYCQSVDEPVGWTGAHQAHL